MASIVGLLVGFVVLLGPPLAVVGLLISASRLRKSDGPRRRIVATYVLAAIVALLIVVGDGVALFEVAHLSNEGAVEPTQKARALAETISEIMNSGAFALFVALGGYVVLVLWSRRPRDESATRGDRDDKQP